MKTIKSFIEKYYGLIISFLLGSLLTIVCTHFYYSIPSIRYDINNDGKVTMADAVKIVNYYIEQRNTDEK